MESFLFPFEIDCVYNSESLKQKETAKKKKFRKETPNRSLNSSALNLETLKSRYISRLLCLSTSTTLVGLGHFC